MRVWFRSSHKLLYFMPAEPVLSGQHVLRGGNHSLWVTTWRIILCRHHNIFINNLKLVQYGYGLVRFWKNIFMIDTALTLASNTWSVKLSEGLLWKSRRSMLSPLANVKSRDRVLRPRKRAKQSWDSSSALSFLFLSHDDISVIQSEGFCFQYLWKPRILPVSRS